MALANIFLTVGSYRLRFPLTPDSISVKKGTTSISFQIIKNGEHKIPRGTAVTGYSWNGTLPGESMSDLGFIFDWQDPQYIVKKLDEWQSSGAKIALTVTEVGIVDKVFIDNVTYTYTGAGHVKYQITLTAYRPLSVTNAPPQPKIVIPEEKPTPAPTVVAQEEPGGGPAPKQSPKTTGKDKKTPLSVIIPTTALAVGALATVAKPVTGITPVAKAVTTGITTGIGSLVTKKDKLKK